MLTGKDAQSLAGKIRELLGSRGAIGNLRVSKRAIEFDLFAEDTGELEERLKMLERALAKLDGQEVYEGIDLGKLRADIRDIIEKGAPTELTIRLISRSAS